MKTTSSPDPLRQIEAPEQLYKEHMHKMLQNTSSPDISEKPNSDIQNKTIVSPDTSSPEQCKCHCHSDAECQTRCRHLFHCKHCEPETPEDKLVSETRKQLAREIREKIYDCLIKEWVEVGHPQNYEAGIINITKLDKILAEYEGEE